jgi:hypothetical protein
MRKLKFNAAHFTGRTQAQEDIIAGIGKCAARWGTRAVRKTECDAPIVWLSQEGRRRWVISGFCETHGSLTKDLSEKEGTYESWARLSEVLPATMIAAEVR